MVGFVTRVCFSSILFADMINCCYGIVMQERRSERLLALQRSIQSLWLQLDLDPATTAAVASLERLLNMDDGVEKLPLTDQTEQSVQELALKVLTLFFLKSEICCLTELGSVRLLLFNTFKLTM